MIPYNYFLQPHDDPKPLADIITFIRNFLVYICSLTTGLLVIYSFFLWLLSLDSVIWSILIPILLGLRVLCIVFYYSTENMTPFNKILFSSLSILYSGGMIYLLIHFAPSPANIFITPMFIDAIPHIMLCVLFIIIAIIEYTKNEGMYYKVPNHEEFNHVFPVVQLIQT